MPHIPKTNIPVLLAEQTIEYQVYQHFVNLLNPFFKPFFYLDILKLRFWEKYYWKKANILVAVSQSDKKKMLKLLPHLKIKIIPNGAGEDLIKIFQKKKKIIKPIFLYQGNFAWLQNTEAASILAKEIFPKIKRIIKDSVCYIAGQKAKEKITNLEKYGVKVIDIDASNIEKVKKNYQEASIFLAPIQGPGGTRLKILGAMTAGIPVISSKIGVDGLDVKNKENVFIAKNPSDFVSYSIKLLKNPSLYQKIREAAKKLVEEKYNWKIIANNLEKIYLSLKRNQNENRH
jgi:glycosyltransferase involved in cell wall biosynthesis